MYYLFSGVLVELRQRADKLIRRIGKSKTNPLSKDVIYEFPDMEGHLERVALVAQVTVYNVAQVRVALSLIPPSPLCIRNYPSTLLSQP